MAGSPQFKVYSADGEYRGSCKYAEDAAALVDFLGDGATIRHGHNKAWTVWTEGRDGRASDSYDVAAETMARNKEDCALRQAQRMVADRNRRQAVRS